MERTETWARAAGIAELTLLVFAHNERARAMYGALGYAEEAYYERDVVRQSGEVYDTIFMTKRLS
jgi:RimJ/RimL family protein N-acetyltransferase